MQDNFPQFFLFNNGYNDEDALRYAISQSLDDEITPPSLRHQNMLLNFNKNAQPDPVSEKIHQVLEMVKDSRCKINDLISLDITSNLNNKRHKEEEQNLSESQKIIKQQDIEYQEVLALAQKNEEINKIHAKEEEEEANEQQNYPEMIRQKFREIGNEPKNGILLAVSIPNKPKITRHFLPESLGNDVYIWVAANEYMISSGFQHGKFRLISAGKVLDDQKSLSEQNIQTRTIFSIDDLQ